MPATFAANISARVRGMKSRLLSRGDIVGMLDNGRLDTMGETLLRTPYEDEMAEALSRYQGAEAIEDAVSRNLVNVFAKLKHMCREDMAELAEIFIARWDLNAVKALLRNQHHGLDVERGLASLVPSPSMPQALQKEFAAYDTMDALVRALAAWNGTLCGVLLEAHGAYQDGRNLRVLEEALDRNYFVNNIQRLERYNSKDARFIQDLLRSEIDRINLRRLFEPRAPGVEAEDVLQQMLPRGTLSRDTLREIATAGTPERAADAVGKTAYGDMAEALQAYAESGKFSYLERQFELRFLAKLKRAVQRQSLGLAILLRYAWLKYNEVMNLRIIAHGLAVHLPKERLEQEVLYA